MRQMEEVPSGLTTKMNLACVLPDCSFLCATSSWLSCAPRSPVGTTTSEGSFVYAKPGVKVSGSLRSIANLMPCGARIRCWP
jgi:hypothetical protein